MPDLNEVDRQLAELGPPPGDVAALLTRHLGTDRSLAMLDQMLMALVQDTGGDNGEEKPAAGKVLTAHSTWADWPGKPEAPPVARASAEPEPASVFPAVPPADAAVTQEEVEPALSLAADSAWPNASTRPSSVPAPASAPAPAPAQDLKSLLDRELDPAEFPGTPAGAEGTVETADDDDFELLIEDEEILEIQEDDVEDVSDEG